MSNRLKHLVAYPNRVKLPVLLADGWQAVKINPMPKGAIAFSTSSFHLRI
ncbi:hypothetical protein [Nostoc sp.]